MPEFILSCPSRQTNLIVDEGNGGQDLRCPSCEVRLPQDLSGHTPPLVVGQPLKSPQPDPAHQQMARLTNPGGAEAAQQKTVLPARRLVENIALGEQTAAGRPKRQGSQMPPPRDAGHKSVSGPVPSISERALTAAPG